jgi:hypothetical protein
VPDKTEKKVWCLFSSVSPDFLAADFSSDFKAIWQFLHRKAIEAADFGRTRSVISGRSRRSHPNRSQAAIDGHDPDAMRTGSAERRSGCCRTRQPSQCLSK